MAEALCRTQGNSGGIVLRLAPTPESGEVVVRIPEEDAQCLKAFEVMAYGKLFGHADRTVQLNALLANEPACISELHLGGRDGGAPGCGITRETA